MFMKRTILFLSILVSIFWVSTRFINTYKYALVGVVFEMLWLPMILLIFCLPVISLYFLLKEKFSFKSAYFFAMLIALNLQTSFLTPPMAMSAYYLKGVQKNNVELMQIFAGIMPFLGIVIFAMFLMYMFPGIALWLPETLFAD